MNTSTCCAKHTPCPSGYIEWHDWAKKMGKTHRPVQCKECGLFAIWVPRKRRKNAKNRAKL